MYNTHRPSHRLAKASNVFIMLGQRATVFLQRLDVRITSAIIQNALKVCLPGRSQTGSGSQPYGNGTQPRMSSHPFWDSGKRRLIRSMHVVH